MTIHMLVEPAELAEGAQGSPLQLPNPPDGDCPDLPSTTVIDVTHGMLSDAAFTPDGIAWHTVPISELKRIIVLPNPQHGVQSKNVEARRERFGTNTIPTGSGPSLAKIIFANFVNSITAILTFLAVVAGYFQDWAAFGVAIGVILFVGVIGAYQEWNAASSLDSLKTMTKGSATVIRDGAATVVSVDDVVIGDVVVLDQGAMVPCDCRLFEAVALAIEESVLTGEPLPVDKHITPVEDASCPLGDRFCMAYRSTTVVSGRGKGIAVAIGLHTEMGKVAAQLSTVSGDSKTGLQRKLQRLMYAIFAVAAVLVLIVFASNRFNMTESVIIYGAAIAIAIMPQSMVAVFAVSMAMSVRKMAAHKCIVRKLGCLEVLDRVTDICSDKTGTLTQNKMMVNRYSIGVGGRTVIMSGAPLNVAAEFKYDDARRDEDASEPIPEMRRRDRRVADFFKACALCGTTGLKCNGAVLEGTGNPTEIAIQALCWKAGCPRDLYVDNEGYLNKGMFVFDSKVKRMTAAYLNTFNRHVFVATKGASESVLALCKWKYNDNAASDLVNENVESSGLSEMTDEDRSQVASTITQFARLGLRTICVACRKTDVPVELKDEQGEVDERVRFTKDPSDTIDKYVRDAIERDHIYLGIVGIYDPPRVESRLSVTMCKRAGIKVRMLTGDHIDTATAIAKEINIISDEEARVEGAVMSGPEFDKMSPEDVAKLPDLPTVIGRCSPSTKLRMIEELHRRGRITAMTGDGFNDSSSIQAADIGCAMGSGTDVTKGVADFIVTDDNFATIVKALAEGRRISIAISKFITHLFTSNMAETVSLIIGLAITLDGTSVFVLSPMEILWLNLFTSSPPAIGFCVDAAPDDVLRVPPNKKGLLTWELMADTICYGTVMGSCTLASFVFVLFGPGGNGLVGKNCNTSDFDDGCESILRARTTAFVLLYLALLVHAYNVRYTRVHIWHMRWFDNPWLWGSWIFGIASLCASVYIPFAARNIFVHGEISWEWAVIGVGLIIFYAFSECYKMLKNIIDPIPVQHVSKEEAANEHALFTGDYHADDSEEEEETEAEAEAEPAKELAEGTLARMHHRQAAFASAI